MEQMIGGDEVETKQLNNKEDEQCESSIECCSEHKSSLPCELSDKCASVVTDCKQETDDLICDINASIVQNVTKTLDFPELSKSIENSNDEASNSNIQPTALSESFDLNKENSKAKDSENKLGCLEVVLEHSKQPEESMLQQEDKVNGNLLVNINQSNSDGTERTISNEAMENSTQESLHTSTDVKLSTECGDQLFHAQDTDSDSAKTIGEKNTKENTNSVDIIKENQAPDTVSLCSTQSCDSEYESDTLLSELETELEQETNGVTYKHLNGIQPVLQSRCAKSQGHKFKEYNTRSGKLIVYSDKQAIEYYELQIEFLERANGTLQRQLAEEKERIFAEDSETKKQLNQMKAELEAKIEKIQKQNETSQKERDNMVLRYAQSERDVIFLKKTREELEKKLREAAKDREGIINRVKGLNVEKARLSGILESKGGEITALRRENERLKEEMNSRDIRIKWTQNKLKTEMDAHKETQVKLEHTVLRLQETREEAEQIRKDTQEMIRRYQEAEEIKSVSLDHQLRQKLGELEVQKQERSDQEEVYQLIKQELEALKKKHKLSIEENNLLTVKIHTLEKERLEHEQTVSKLKECQNTLRQEVVDLAGQLAEKQNLEIQLEREKERVVACQKEVERYRMANAEFQTDMEACRNKEGELLEFTERLTAKSVQLQSEHSLLETKSNTLEDEMNRINKKCVEWEQQNLELINQLDQEKNQRKEETQLLARKLAEKTKSVEQLLTKLEDAENENRVMKRRHITSIKELSRELQQSRKRLYAYEINQSGDTLSLGSRTSSTGSLDTITNSQQNNHHISTNHNSGSNVQPTVAFTGGKCSTKNTPAQTKSDSKSSPVQPRQQKQNSPPPSNASPLIEVDKQMLIERIVKVQKVLARKNEKIEFQEEHINHLIAEMKKKARIIQSYIVREEAGALSSSSMDQNKADVMKRGGIMASVYSSHAADSHMTLELSLEINTKLQAVLEDTLLKNITLKENINTLGEEIARLTKQQRLLSNQITKAKNIK